MKIKYQDTSSRITLKDIINLPEGIRKDLYEAMRYDIALFAWICFPHIVKDIPNFHKDIYTIWDEISQHKLDFAAFVVFRGAAKSTLKNIVILHAICYKLEDMILFLSEAEDQAKRDIRAIEAEAENNPMLRALYGMLKPQGKCIWSAYEAEFANGCYIVSKGWKSRSRGIKNKNFRPSLIILDDFEGEDNTESPTIRKRLRKWVEAIVIPAGDVDVRVIFMGTIVHPDSYLSNLKDHGIMKGNRSVYYEKSISEYVNKDGKVVKDFNYDHPVWEKRYDKAWWERTKKIFLGGKDPRPALLYQEFFNIPEQESEPIFDVDQLTEVNAQFKKKGDLTYLEYFKDSGETVYIPLNIFTGVDPNHREKKTSDPFCSVTLGMDPDENVYYINIINKVISLEDRIDVCSREGSNYGTKGMTVESYGAQFDLIHWVKKKNLDRGYHFPIGGYEKRLSKSVKWKEGLVPMFNSGKMYYLKGCPHVETLKNQARLSTGGDDHDDMLDGTFLALLPAYPPHRMNIKKLLALSNNRRNKKESKRNWYTI